MSLLKRVFSADFRRALAAEAAGDYLEAAKAYALAGEKVKVAEMHLCAAERAGGIDGRLTELRAAVRWAEAETPEAHAVRRRIARAMVAHVRASGVLSDGDRKLLRNAAALFTSAGDAAGAGECLELAGDEAEAAEAYQAAGDVERLEQVLARDEARRHHGQRLREAFEEYQLHLASGARDEAIARLRECVTLESVPGASSSASRQLLEALSARRLAAGVVAIRVEPAALATTYIGIFPFGLGREMAAEVALRDGRVSRRHAEIVAQGGHFLLRDCRSRNGTRLGGVRIEGEIPLAGEGDIGLGDFVVLAFRVEGARIRLEVTRGADRGMVAVAAAQAHRCGWS